MKQPATSRGSASGRARGTARATQRDKKPDLTTADAVELAMKAMADGAGVGSPAAQLIDEQRRLVRWQVASERLSVILKVLTALVGAGTAAAAAGLLVTLAWHASRSRDLIIEPFSTPPALAAEGLSGEVVASRLLDRMASIQGAVQTQRAPSTFARTWEGDVKIAIPQAGVTLGQLERQLRVWLGHDTHVRGEVVQRGAELEVTVRVGQAPGQTFRGASAQLDLLVDRAGEAAFGAAEPFLYGVWLRARGRTEDARLVFERLSRTGPAAERAWGLVGLANGARDTEGLEGALRYSRVAHSLAPAQLLPPTNMATLSLELGRPEDARKALAIALRNVNRKGGISDLKAGKNVLLALRAQLDGDYATALRLMYDGLAAGGQARTQARNYNSMGRVVIAAIAMHDLGAARRALAEATVPGVYATPSLTMDDLIMRLRLRAAEGDGAAVLALQAEAEALATEWPALRDRLHRHVYTVAALALAQQGELGAAQALIAKTPSDCYEALIVRGRIAARVGDPVQTDLWFARAVKLAPRSPQAESEWARALLDRGQTEAAIARAVAAHRKGPRFADPLEIWGEALLATGRGQAAAKKFEEGAGLTPRWGLLHLRWGEALAAQGMSEEAHAKWRAAAGMDLTQAERAELQAVLKRTT